MTKRLWLLYIIHDCTQYKTSAFFIITSNSLIYLFLIALKMIKFKININPKIKEKLIKKLKYIY